MILNYALVNDSSAALIDLKMLLSAFKSTRNQIQSSSLGGFRENSASRNSSGNFPEIAYEVSVEIPLAIKDEIFSEISFDTKNG